MARGRARKRRSKAPLLSSRSFVERLGAGARRTLEASAAGLSARSGARGRASGKAKGRIKDGAGGQGRSGAARQRVREIIALALLGLTLILLLACLSAYGDRNLCGPTGEALARLLLGSFGYAAYLLVACLGLWGLTLFARVQPESLTVRFSGLALCLVAFAALLAHLFGDVSHHFPAGGVVGEFINHQLQVVGGFGVWGTRIVLLVLTLCTFVLATDVMYYTSIMAGVGWVRRRRLARMAAAASSGRPGAGAAVLEDDETGDDAAEGATPAAHTRDKAAGRRPSRAAPRAPRGWIDRLLGRRPANAVAPDEASLAPFEALEHVPGASIPEGVVLDLPVEDEDELLDEDEPDAGEDTDELAVLDDVSSDAKLKRAARPTPVVRHRDERPTQLTLYGEAAEPTPVVRGEYVFPGRELLEKQTSVDQRELDELLADKTEVLERTLASFKVEARVVEIQKGPVISMFEMELAPGIKVEKVRSLEDDLAIALRARTVRIVAPIPGKNTIGIEVPNPLRETVRMRPLLECSEFAEGKFALPIFLGRDASGRPMVVDLAKMPHLLVAGATGSGKSVCLNTIIVSFLYTRTPEQVKLILIDPKMVELSQFGNAPHLACPVISDMKRAPAILDWAIEKMEERYRLLNRAGVRNIYSYNKLGAEGLRPHFGERVDEPEFPIFLPFLVIVVDELADLMMVSAKEVETSITRLAAKSRAVGIHLIVATQRPSTNVITGLIKANLPTRIAFMVSSKIDSRVILDENGAEQLLGEGDMLVMSPQSSALVRGQGSYLGEEEVRRVMEAVRTESGPAYVPELVQRRSKSDTDPDDQDELYDAAVRFVFATERGSASLLQRKFAIGYTRASRLIDMMAEEGVLGEYKGSQARELTMTLEEWTALKPEARASGEEEADAGP